MIERCLCIISISISISILIWLLNIEITPGAADDFVPHHFAPESILDVGWSVDLGIGEILMDLWEEIKVVEGWEHGTLTSREHPLYLHQHS